MSHNFLAPGRIIICNKATPVGLLSITAEPSLKFLQVASTIERNTYNVEGVPGTYIVFGEEPLISTGEPMRANFKESGDAIVFAYKSSGKFTYLYGITVEGLIAWVPPTKAGELMNEDGKLQSWKTTHTDLVSVVPLLDSETHPLRAMADKFLSHMPTFAVHKIKDMKGARAWCGELRCYASNIKAVVDKSEVEERQRGKEKSTTAKDKGGVESAAAGEVAKDSWTEIKRCLLTVAPYYEDTFKERFIVVELDAVTGQPSEETLEAVRKDLE